MSDLEHFFRGNRRFPRYQTSCEGAHLAVRNRDAILPTFSGFPDFSSVQCKNEIRLSLFKIVIFTLKSIPMPFLINLNAKITFLYEQLHPFTFKSQNPEMSFLLFRIFHHS